MRSLTDMRREHLRKAVGDYSLLEWGAECATADSKKWIILLTIIAVVCSGSLWTIPVLIAFGAFAAHKSGDAYRRYRAAYIESQKELAAFAKEYPDA